jgi:DNA-binding SARP family transcriptional activator
VTTATAERTFSSLRLLKSYVRTTMGPDRLAGLTLLYLHRDVSVTVDEVIDVFARQCSRRLEFVLE